ncbi:Ig-like domain-containing protein, partial [Maribacter sp.]
MKKITHSCFYVLVMLVAHIIWSQDTTPPTLVSLSPTDTAMDIEVSSDIIIVFSEKIQLGAGNLLLFDVTNTVAIASIAVDDVNQIRIDDNELIINPSSNLPFGTNISLEIPQGAIEDAFENTFSGLELLNYSFTTKDEPDTTPPVITLLGDNPLILNAGNSYIESGATATDNVDGDISGNIVIDASALNSNEEGSYEVTYNVSDAAGNAANEVTRTIEVEDPPILVSTIPANGAVEVPFEQDIVLTFDEPILFGDSSNIRFEDPIFGSIFFLRGD